MDFSYDPDEFVAPVAGLYRFSDQPPSLVKPAPDPVRVDIRVAYGNGAVREYSALHPLGFRLAIEASKDAAAGAATGAGHFEPALLVTFQGNPAAGGISVRPQGTPPQ